MNQFDHKMIVTIADVSKGVAPLVLEYFPHVGAEKESFPPDLESHKGTPIHQVPRPYAERLLANQGGRTWILVSPNELIVKKSDTLGHVSYVTLRAHKQLEDGSWVEKTDEEIKAQGIPSVQPALKEALTEKKEEPKAESKPAEPTRKRR